MDLKNLNINKVVQTLVMADVVLFFAIGLFTPIFALFIIGEISGGTISAVGIASALYWVSRLLTTVPLSRFMDKTDGEKDEFYFMVIGMVMISLIFFLYTFAEEIWHVYALQAMFGTVNSMVIPAWRIVFTNHIDHGRTGYYWSIEDIGIGAATASSAFFGALLAEKFGFDFVLYIVSGLALASAVVIGTLKKYTYTLKEVKRLSKERKKMRPIIKPKKNHNTH